MAVSPVVGSNASLGPDVTAQTACLQAAKGQAGCRRQARAKREGGAPVNDTSWARAGWSWPRVEEPRRRGWQPPR